MAERRNLDADVEPDERREHDPETDDPREGDESHEPKRGDPPNARREKRRMTPSSDNKAGLPPDPAQQRVDEPSHHHARGPIVAGPDSRRAAESEDADD
ncbi:MAG: hypothetical protein U0Q11_22155 [Vicinamibacterales bacterium]